MPPDILKEILYENPYYSRYSVGVKEWEKGGNVIRYSDKQLPFENPVIASPSNNRYISSGGRSILIDDPGCPKKLKGIDPTGYVHKIYTKMKGDSIEGMDTEDQMLYVTDEVLLSLMGVKKGEHSLLKDGTLGRHDDSPFGVLTLKQARNEKMVLDILKSAYSDYGYLPSQDPLAIYVFNDLDFDSGKTASILTELPVSIGSDLRLRELHFFVRKKYLELDRSESGYDSKVNDMMALYEQIYRWIGFEARLFFDNNLKPVPRSFSSMNFCVRYMNDEMDIGISRVDHGSTEIGGEVTKEFLFSILKNQVDVFHPLLSKVHDSVAYEIDVECEKMMFEQYFEDGWNGIVEPLNPYLEAVVAC